MVDSKSGHAVVYQSKDNALLRDRTWKLYKLGARGAWSPIKEFIDKHTKDYAETPQEFAYRIDKAAV